MEWLNRFIMPLVLILTFGLALVAVTARSFLPGDMAAPAPTGIIVPADVDTLR